MLIKILITLLLFFSGQHVAEDSPYWDCHLFGNMTCE